MSFGLEHPALRVEVSDAEPEDTMPSLALGTLDLVLADDYPFLRLPPSVSWWLLVASQTSQRPSRMRSRPGSSFSSRQAWVRTGVMRR